VLERICGGVRLSVTAAIAAGEDDIVMVEPEQPLPPAVEKPPAQGKSPPKPAR